MTAPIEKPGACAIEDFFGNVEQMVEVILALGELDEPEMFERDLKAARTQLAALKARVAEANEDSTALSRSIMRVKELDRRVGDLEMMLRYALDGGCVARSEHVASFLEKSDRDQNAELAPAWIFGPADGDDITIHRVLARCDDDGTGLPLLTDEARAVLTDAARDAMGGK